MTESIGFRPLTEEDLPTMHGWLNRPEVAQWYGLDLDDKTYPTLEEVAANYLPMIESADPVFCYVITIRGVDAGYIQCYRMGDHPEYAEALSQGADAWAVDLFIGEDRYRGKGLGPLMLREFVDREVLTRPGATGAVIAPNPKNQRAIRSYEKAGFKYLRTAWVPEEEAHEYVMVLPKQS